MAGAWLPYARAWPSPPQRRPPAISLPPAVALPLLPAAALLAAVAWTARTHPALPVGASVAPRPIPAPPPSPTFPLPDPVNLWVPEIASWSAAYHLPADLVAVVMTIESCGDPAARSRAGAQGLFQVMPFHFAAGENPIDPEVNARRGLEYLSRALDLAAGDEGLALAGYNGGHGVIGRSPAAWPAETRRYVAWGTGILGDLRAGLNPSPTLQSWLDAGGSALCRRAASAN